MRWDVFTEMTPHEQEIVERLRRSSKFFKFLFEIRAELFDEDFQDELIAAYKTPRCGKTPVPPALLAMVTLMQCYKGLSDVDAVDAAENDRRWKLVLGTLGQVKAPFGQGSLVRFRLRMIEHDLDRKLVDRTVELAKETGGFGWQMVKAALDSSPLLGAGRVEDTWNLIGRAMAKVVDAISVATGVDSAQLIEEADLYCLSGPSVKAMLDIDWDDREQRHEALQELLGQAERLSEWVQEHALSEAQKPPLSGALEDLIQVMEQDLEPDPDKGGMRIGDGVAKDRMPSLGDKQMRHGRKSKAKAFTGYKRHVARFVGIDLIAGGLVLPANVPEHEATEQLLEDANRHGKVSELEIDRGYLASEHVAQFVQQGGEVHCRPWPAHNQGRFTKEDFGIDLENRQVTCPAGTVVSIKPNARLVRFPASACGACSMKTKCTKAKRGRTVSIHRQEALMQRLRARKKTSEGRAQLRERVQVEHSLAAISQLQGPRARYKGARKNTLDVRRAAAVSNLRTVSRLRQEAVSLAA